MSASAAARSLFRIPLAKGAFRQTDAGEEAARRYGRNVPVQSIANIVRRAGYNIAQLSITTGKRYGGTSTYFVPPTFLYKLRSGVTPHICQIVALSETTGYRFVDWMRIFGFDLHQIPRLQVQLHSERTVLVTPIEFETAFWRAQSSTIHKVVCSSSMPSRPGEGWRSARGRYWFAKIGRRDALLCPRLIPGRIVRVDRCYWQRVDGVRENFPQNLLWLVEHSGELTCCQIRWIDDHQIVLLPSRPPWGTLPLHVPTEARVLGLVNLESGSVKAQATQPEARPTKFEQRLAPPFCRRERRFSDLLRCARRRTGLTFRAAHHLTGAIAQNLHSQDYAISLGLLSDYEATGRLPRHIAKILSLCITYCLDIRQLLEAAGVYIDDSAKMPLPSSNHLAATGADFFDSTEHYRTIALGAGYVRSRSGSFEKISRI